MQAAEFHVITPGWRPQAPISWIQCSNGNYPDNAVESGYDSGARIFVARAHFQGALIPGLSFCASFFILISCLYL